MLSITPVISQPINPDNRQDNSVGRATDYGLDDRSSIRVRNKRLFPTPMRPDQFWGQPILPFNGYWRTFSGGKVAET
jgi:hypothetical protein